MVVVVVVAAATAPLLEELPVAMTTLAAEGLLVSCPVWAKASALEMASNMILNWLIWKFNILFLQCSAKRRDAG